MIGNNDRFMSGMMSGFMSKMQAAFDKMGDVVHSMTYAVEPVMPVVQIAAPDDFLSKIKGQLSAVFGGVKEQFCGTIGNVVNNVRESIGGVFERVKETFGNVKEKISGTIGNVVNNVRESIGGVFERARETFGNVKEKIGGTIGNVVNNVRESVGGVFERVKETFGGVKEKIGGTIGNVVNNVRESVGGIFERVKETFGSVKEKIGGTIGNVVNNVRESVGGVFERVRETFGGVAGGLSAASLAMGMNVMPIQASETTRLNMESPRLLPIRAENTSSETRTGARFEKFCDYVEINLPQGTAGQQAELLLNELMRRINDAVE